jgi:hypothetical protein
MQVRPVPGGVHCGAIPEAELDTGKLPLLGAHLEAVDTYPAYAQQVLVAAEAGQRLAYTVQENLGNVAVNRAMDGCRVYAEGASE